MRCRWSWIDEYRGYGGSADRDGARDIVFMATPKFDSEVGEVEADLVKEFRDNEKCRHAYMQGGKRYNDWKLIFEWSKQQATALGLKAAHERGYVGVGEGKQALAAYRDKIVWL